jgi:hypothetical protein
LSASLIRYSSWSLAFFGTAAYGGRFGGGKRAKGIKLGSKTGWILMELPGLLVFPVVFFMGPNADQSVPLFFLGVWMFHYTNRALVAPMLMRVQPGLNGELLARCCHRRVGNTLFTRLLQCRLPDSIR